MASNEITADSTSTNENTHHTTEIQLPKPKDRIQVMDASGPETREYLVISRAGKASGAHKYWLNTKDMQTGEIKPMNFSEITNWTMATDEILYCAENDPATLEAKLNELERWKEYSVYDEVEDQGNETISTRWVISEKNETGKTCIKARLVARGFEEDGTQIRKDSPTAMKANIRLVSNLAVTNGWQIRSIDVKSAFLQGFPIDRDIYLLPPPEANTNKLWKLNTAVYGLRDASRAWYLKVCEELVNAGASRSKYDNALFFWRHDGKLHGLINTHVDDFFHAGSELFKNTVIQHLRDKFNLSSENDSDFMFLGIKINQTNDAIQMNQNHYIDELGTMPLTNNIPDRALTRGECRQLKGLVGQLQWVSKQTRPDIAFSTCQLSTRMKNADVNDVKAANKQVIKLKQNAVNLEIPHTGSLEGTKFHVYSDASHGNLPSGASQGGFILFLHGSNNKSAPLMWVSRKLRRVVKSAMAAETMALIEAAEHAMLLRELLCKITATQTSTFPIVCFTDSKSLKEAAYSTKAIEDKRLQIDISSLREMIQEKDIDEIRHVQAVDQLADCLTKSTAPSDKLLRVLGGEIMLVD